MVTFKRIWVWGKRSKSWDNILEKFDDIKTVPFYATTCVLVILYKFVKKKFFLLHCAKKYTIFCTRIVGRNLFCPSFLRFFRNIGMLKSCATIILRQRGGHLFFLDTKLFPFQSNANIFGNQRKYHGAARFRLFGKKVNFCEFPIIYSNIRFARYFPLHSFLPVSWTYSML